MELREKIEEAILEYTRIWKSQDAIYRSGVEDYEIDMTKLIDAIVEAKEQPNE